MKKWLVAIMLLLTVEASGRKFQHIVILVQENRTPDNLFGSNPTFKPGVDLASFGIGLNGETIPLTPLPWVDCYDLPHAHASFLKDYNGGQMNGWDRNKVNPKPGCNPGLHPAYHYADNSHGEIQPYFDIASQYGWANRMFQTNQGPSFPAHQFLVSATSSPDDASSWLTSENQHLGGLAIGCNAPPDAWVQTIDPNGILGRTFPCFPRSSLIDLLEAAGLSWRYYTPSGQVQWVAPAALEYHYQSPNLVLVAKQVLQDVSACNLPNVAWVIPNGQNSDHAGTKGGGPAWVASIVNAIGTSSCGYWLNTAILITWDDWGGWYDHVPPAKHPDGWCNSYCYGFRVPLLVVSTYTPSMVDNAVHDFSSILKFAEVNFGLGLIGPGTFGDAYADDLSEFFTGSRRPFVKINSPSQPYGDMPYVPPDDD